MENKVGFCTTPDNVRIAYQTLGNGPAIVCLPAYFVAVDIWPLIPELKNYVEAIASYHSVVLYDMRGAGMSDRNRTVFTLESELSDLETIIDHLKLDKVILFGWSMCGPVAVAYAAKHPERVSHLVLYGTYAYLGKYIQEDIRSSILALLRQQNNYLGIRAIHNLMTPKGSGDFLELMVAMFKESVTPEVFARLIELCFTLDVTEYCNKVKAPTLVMHRKGDLWVSYRAGVELASLIPDARFVPLEGDTHEWFFGDCDMVLQSQLQFLGDQIEAGKDKSTETSSLKKTGHDVFISFAYSDRDTAARIYDCFKSNGINPFWCEQLAAGQDYPELLGEAIRNSKSFLLVVSDSTDNSDSVRKETTIAHNNKKPIIPVRIKNVMPKKLEYLIASSLFFDAFPQPLAQHLPRLASDIRKILGGKADKKEKIKK